MTDYLEPKSKVTEQFADTACAIANTFWTSVAFHTLNQCTENLESLVTGGALEELQVMDW